MKDVKVTNAHVMECYGNSKDKEIVIDFNNGWHHACKISYNISVVELSEILYDFAKEIGNNQNLKGK